MSSFLTDWKVEEPTEQRRSKQIRKELSSSLEYVFFSPVFLSSFLVLLLRQCWQRKEREGMKEGRATHRDVHHFLLAATALPQLVMDEAKEKKQRAGDGRTETDGKVS